MGLTPFPNGVSSFGSPVTSGSRHFLANGAKAYFVGGPNSSDDNKGTDYDRPLNLISKATVDKVKNSSTGSVEHGTRGAGDFVYVSTGTYAENVRIIDRNYTRIIGAGMGICTLTPGDTTTSQNTDALGQSQTITLQNQTTQMTDWAFIIGSRGVEISGFTISGVANAAGATGGFYIGDGGVINASNNWGSSQFHISDILLDGEGGIAGGWAFVWDGFGPGGIIENVTIARYRSGGLLVNGGTTRETLGGTFRHNIIIGCRGYGIRRSASYAGWQGTGLNTYAHNIICDDDDTAFTNGILLGANTTLGDSVVGNYVITSAATPISMSNARDRHSGNYTSVAGSSAVTYVSMA